MERPYFPMFIDMTGKSVLVAGGGRIALRRVRDYAPVRGAGPAWLRLNSALNLQRWRGAGRSVLCTEHMRREILRGHRLCWLPRTAGR